MIDINLIIIYIYIYIFKNIFYFYPLPMKYIRKNNNFIRINNKFRGTKSTTDEQKYFKTKYYMYSALHENFYAITQIDMCFCLQ